MPRGLPINLHTFIHTYIHLSTLKHPPTLLTQFLERQSLATRQPMPTAHPGQALPPLKPPQSLPVSKPFFKPSVHVWAVAAAAHRATTVHNSTQARMMCVGGSKRSARGEASEWFAGRGHVSRWGVVVTENVQETDSLSGGFLGNRPC